MIRDIYNGEADAYVSGYEPIGNLCTFFFMFSELKIPLKYKVLKMIL